MLEATLKKTSDFKDVIKTSKLPGRFWQSELFALREITLFTKEHRDLLPSNDADEC